jgi:transposase
VRAFVEQQWGKRLSPRSCLRYLHRLGFVWKRPKRQFLKANAERRAAFVDEYRTLVDEAAASGVHIFFADEAHFRADGDLRGLWTQRGEEALVPSTSPKYGAKASYYAAVCVDTGDVVAARVEGTTTAATSVAFLQGLRAEVPGDLVVIWDNGPAHHGEAMRQYLATPELRLRLLALPPYSPDYNPAEAIWKWVREEVTANTCFGSAATVAAAVTAFLERLDQRTDEVKHRCRSALHTAVDPDTSRHPVRRERRLDRRARLLSGAGSM